MMKARGDEALFEYTEKFDKVKVTKDTIRVTKEEIDEALKQVDPKLMEVMVKSMKNIRAFHEKQKAAHGLTRHQTARFLVRELRR